MIKTTRINLILSFAFLLTAIALFFAVGHAEALQLSGGGGGPKLVDEDTAVKNPDKNYDPQGSCPSCDNHSGAGVNTGLGVSTGWAAKLPSTNWPKPPKSSSGGSSSSGGGSSGGSSGGGSGGSVCDKASDPCGLNSDDDDDKGSSRPVCPEGQTMVTGGCCPSEYVKTTGSGKGATRSCDAPPPPPSPTATISQSDITTSPGESFTVTYGRSSGVATHCSLQHKEPGDPFSQIHSNTGGTSNIDQSLNDLGTHTYRARCTGPGGVSSWVSLDHNVSEEPPALSFTADEYVVPYDTTTTLRWNSENAVSCTASGAWSGSKAVDGSEITENLTDTTTYLLQCRDGSDRFTSPRSVTIDVESGTGADISTNHSITRNNSDVEVSWNTGSSDPSSCRIETGSNTLLSPLSSNTGSFTHTITGETTFILNCEDGANTDQVTVQILPEFQET